jgi:hypothetical protein
MYFVPKLEYQKRDFAFGFTSIPHVNWISMIAHDDLPGKYLCPLP